MHVADPPFLFLAVPRVAVGVWPWLALSATIGSSQGGCGLRQSARCRGRAKPEGGSVRGGESGTGESIERPPLYGC